ncbi:MAG: MFS transporter [Thermomicrobiales bacterium]
MKIVCRPPGGRRERAPILGETTDAAAQSSPPKLGGAGGAVVVGQPANEPRATTQPSFSGWAVFGFAGTVLFCSQLAQTPVFGVLVDPMRADLGWSRSAVSSIYTAAILIGAGLVLVAGRLIDRHGRRRVRLWSAIAFALALIAMGTVFGPVSLFLALVVPRLGGGSVLSLAARTLVSTWFARRRGRAISLLNFRYERSESLDATAWSDQNDDTDADPCDVLLMLEVPVHRHERAKAGRCRLSEQCAVAHARPSHLASRTNLVR